MFLALVCHCALPASPAEPAHGNEHRIPFRTVGDSMILVPVEINGGGPFQFFVDTGTSRTIVDQKLADELSLPVVPKTSIKLTGISGTSTVSLVRVDSLAVAGQTLHDMRLSVGRQLPEGVRGILGEDFLAQFDVLIDYRRHSLELSSDPLSLAVSLSGEHLPISAHGVFSGTPTANRIVMEGRANEFGDRKLSFLLDSGTNAFVLFASPANRLDLFTSNQDSIGNPQQTVGRLSISRKKLHFLLLGGKSIPDVSAAIVNGHDPVDVDGVVPTAWFSSLFLCHTGGYVIFNPSRRNTSGLESAQPVVLANSVSPGSR